VSLPLSFCCFDLQFDIIKIVKKRRVGKFGVLSSEFEVRRPKSDGLFVKRFRSLEGEKLGR
jgi:hypothetical protein